MLGYCSQERHELSLHKISAELNLGEFDNTENPKQYGLSIRSRVIKKLATYDACRGTPWKSIFLMQYRRIRGRHHQFYKCEETTGEGVEATWALADINEFQF